MGPAQQITWQQISLSQQWQAGNIPEESFLQEIKALETRITDLQTEIPHVDLSAQMRGIDRLRGKITWTDHGYQAQKINSCLAGIARVLRWIFGGN